MHKINQKNLGKLIKTIYFQVLKQLQEQDPMALLFITKHQKNLIKLLKKMIFFYVILEDNINMEQQM